MCHFMFDVSVCHLDHWYTTAILVVFEGVYGVRILTYHTLYRLIDCSVMLFLMSLMLITECGKTPGAAL